MKSALRHVDIPSKLLRRLFVLPFIAASIGIASAEPGVTDFALAPGDLVRLDILDDDQLPFDLPVAPDGTIQAPLLGSVKVGGLTVAAALTELNESYVDQKIFVVPKLGFSVATYRPIFVIGDVRTPGAYAFQPQLTVEKAIGLAGGQTPTNPAEDPILARARLRGQMETIDASIATEAFAVARLTALLDGRAEFEDRDIPETAREYVNGTVALSVRAVEARIAKASAEGFAAQEKVMKEQIVEAEKSQALYQDLLKNAGVAIELSRGDLERAQTLRKRGLNTQSDISNLQRQAAMEESRQLQTLASLSDSRRDLGMLRSKLTDLEQQRHIGALQDLQTHNVALAAQLAARRAAEEQLVLMTNLTAEELQKNREITLEFSVRRGVGDNMVNSPVTSTSLLAPGDVLSVTIRRSDDKPTASVPAGGAPANALSMNNIAVQPPVTP
jgi:exopolysaccharide production protein ExoF